MESLLFRWKLIKFQGRSRRRAPLTAKSFRMHSILKLGAKQILYQKSAVRIVLQEYCQAAAKGGASLDQYRTEHTEPASFGSHMLKS